LVPRGIPTPRRGDYFVQYTCLEKCEKDKEYEKDKKNKEAEKYEKDE